MLMPTHATILDRVADSPLSRAEAALARFHLHEDDLAYVARLEKDGIDIVLSDLSSESASPLDDKCPVASELVTVDVRSGLVFDEQDMANVDANYV